MLGLPGPDESLRTSFASLVVPQDTTTVMLDLRGAGSPRLFSPGVWNAELTLAPVLATGVKGIGPAPSLYSIDTSFVVDTGPEPPPPSGTPEACEGCLGVSP